MKIKTSISILAIIIFIGWIVWYKNASISEPTNTQKLSQGTVMNFGEISIGLGNINDKSASLVIHKEGLTDSVSKTVVAGDKVEMYGYTINVSSVEKPFNSSLLPGSSHGSVRFTVSNKE